MNYQREYLDKMDYKAESIPLANIEELNFDGSPLSLTRKPQIVPKKSSLKGAAEEESKLIASILSSEDPRSPRKEPVADRY